MKYSTHTRLQTIRIEFLDRSSISKPHPSTMQPEPTHSSKSLLHTIPPYAIVPSVLITEIPDPGKFKLQAISEDSMKISVKHV